MDIEQELTILLNVFIASILSGIIGFERERINKPAGLRTNMIIGGSVALLMGLSEVLVVEYTELTFSDAIRSDPIRILQAIFVGISFIGAGTVLQSPKEERVRYLTTAATILFSAGIGIAVGMRKYILATGICLFVLLINYGVKKLEQNMHIKKKNKKKQTEQT